MNVKGFMKTSLLVVLLVIRVRVNVSRKESSEYLMILTIGRNISEEFLEGWIYEIVVAHE